MTEKKRGGKREGAGRKSRYNEPTEQISFHCPKSKVEEMKLHIEKKLKKYLPKKKE